MSYFENLKVLYNDIINKKDIQIVVKTENGTISINGSKMYPEIEDIEMFLKFYIINEVVKRQFQEVCGHIPDYRVDTGIIHKTVLLDPIKPYNPMKPE